MLPGTARPLKCPSLSLSHSVQLCPGPTLFCTTRLQRLQPLEKQAQSSIFPLNGPKLTGTLPQHSLTEHSGRRLKGVQSSMFAQHLEKQVRVLLATTLLLCAFLPGTTSEQLDLDIECSVTECSDTESAPTRVSPHSQTHGPPLAHLIRPLKASWVTGT